MIRAIYFDFDGVLSTDKNGNLTTCGYLAKETGLDYEKVIECYRGNSKILKAGGVHSEMWADFCACLGKDIDISLLKGAFLSSPRNEVMFELAKALKKHYKLGIITDNPKERFDTLIEAWKLNELFDTVVVSANVGSTKKEPAIFEKALVDLNMKADEAVFIDNNKVNLVVSGEMGMHVIYYDDAKNDIEGLKKELERMGVTY